MRLLARTQRSTKYRKLTEVEMEGSRDEAFVVFSSPSLYYFELGPPQA